MILYIFNNPFPDSSGFGKRCKKEIEVLSQNEEVIVLCKKGYDDKPIEFIKIGNKQVKIVRFNTLFTSNQAISDYQVKKGFYELVRNVDLLVGLTKELVSLYWQNRSKKINIYCIVSPLTVPLIAYVSGILFNIKPLVVEFHDLEPEMAMHIKNLNKNSFITKVELFLEKSVCKLYKRIIVTTQAQKERIVKRNGIQDSKVFVLPNSIQVDITKHSKNTHRSVFNIGYVSSFSYRYSVSGVIELLEIFSKNKIAGIKFWIVGDGALLSEIQNKVKDLQLLEYVTFTGKVDNIQEIISSFDVAIVPWKQDTMTETMMPTKLFEYMEGKVPIIAPNFGEFKNILSHNTDALLYNSNMEILNFINKLKVDQDLVIRLRDSGYKTYSHFFRHGKIISMFQKFILT